MYNPLYIQSIVQFDILYTQGVESKAGLYFGHWPHAWVWTPGTCSPQAHPSCLTKPPVCPHYKQNNHHQKHCNINSICLPSNNLRDIILWLWVRGTQKSTKIEPSQILLIPQCRADNLISDLQVLPQSADPSFTVS